MTYNFSTFNGLFFFAGLYGLKKVSPSRSFTSILLAVLILFFIFAFRYAVPDRYSFFIPFYCVGSVIGGVGFDMFITQPDRRILRGIVFSLALFPVPTYIIAPIVAQKMQFNLSTKRDIPYRNEYIWFLRPWQTGYHGPEKFANEALDAVEDNAIIYADGTTVYPLWYVQKVKGTAPSVKIVSQHRSYKNLVSFPTVDTIEQMMAEQNIYVVSPVAGYCPDYLLKHYNFVKTGPIYRVVNRR